MKPVIQDLVDVIQLSWKIHKLQVQQSEIQKQMTKIEDQGLPLVSDIYQNLYTYEHTAIETQFKRFGTGASLASLERTFSDLKHREILFKGVPGLRFIIEYEAPAGRAPGRPSVSPLETSDDILSLENMPIGSSVVEERAGGVGVADEKRKRDATASYRFRQRQKEKERETSQDIAILEKQINDIAEVRDFYRLERDYYHGLISRNPNQAHLAVKGSVPSTVSSELLEQEKGHEQLQYDRNGIPLPSVHQRHTFTPPYMEYSTAPSSISSQQASGVTDHPSKPEMKTSNHLDLEWTELRAREHPDVPAIIQESKPLVAAEQEVVEEPNRVPRPDVDWEPDSGTTSKVDEGHKEHQEGSAIENVDKSTQAATTSPLIHLLNDHELLYPLPSIPESGSAAPFPYHIDPSRLDYYQKPRGSYRFYYSRLVSDETPGVPSPPSQTSATKQKPAALKLETADASKAPQPSAQLLSLRLARPLSSLKDVSYPEGIAASSPALNETARLGKFRYDEYFLTQFQSVFVEKPSADWDDRIKEVPKMVKFAAGYSPINNERHLNNMLQNVNEPPLATQPATKGPLRPREYIEQKRDEETANKAAAEQAFVEKQIRYLSGADGNAIGKLVEGNPGDLIGKTLNEEGEILDEDGDVVGRAMVVPGIDTLEGHEIGEGGKIFNEDGEVIGQLTEGDAEQLAGPRTQQANFAGRADWVYDNDVDHGEEERPSPPPIIHLAQSKESSTPEYNRVDWADEGSSSEESEYDVVGRVEKGLSTSENDDDEDEAEEAEEEEDEVMDEKEAEMLVKDLLGKYTTLFGEC